MYLFYKPYPPSGLSNGIIVINRNLLSCVDIACDRFTVRTQFCHISGTKGFPQYITAASDRQVLFDSRHGDDQR